MHVAALSGRLCVIVVWPRPSQGRAQLHSSHWASLEPIPDDVDTSAFGRRSSGAGMRLTQVTRRPEIRELEPTLAPVTSSPKREPQQSRKFLVICCYRRRPTTTTTSVLASD